MTKRCLCCGSRTNLTFYELKDGRTWCSCAACAARCVHCLALLQGARELISVEISIESHQ